MDVYLSEVVRYLTAQSGQIAVLATAIAVLTFLLRSRSAHARYLLWLIVVAKCLLPPLYAVPLRVLPQVMPHGSFRTVFAPTWSAEAVDVPGRAAGTISAPPPRDSVPSTQPPQTHGHRLSASGKVGLLWTIGAGAYLALNLLRAGRGYHWLRRRRQALPDDLQADTERLLAAYGVGRLPPRWILEGIEQPFVWGLARGSIYVPPSLFQIKSYAHRRDILGHEVSHVLRFDAAVNLLQILAQALFWFHPLVWWANRKIRQEREKCCDEMAIAHLQAEPKDYSRALVEALSFPLQSNRFVPSLAIAGPARHIEERIKTMLRPGKRFYRRPSLPTVIVAVALALVAVPTTWALANRAAAESPEGNMNAKIAQLQPGVSTKQDAIRVFGKPTQYRWGDKTFQEDSLPSIYLAVFPNAPYIVFDGDIVGEIRFEEQDFGYAFRD
jgi:beta-lactamase regulating signal transducer with metallopeptidase domain